MNSGLEKKKISIIKEFEIYTSKPPFQPLEDSLLLIFRICLNYVSIVTKGRQINYHIDSKK